MKNATPHRNRGYLKKAKAPRGAYTYLRAPVILAGDRAADAPVVPTFAAPVLSTCRDYGLPVRPKIRPVVDADSLVILGFIS